MIPPSLFPEYKGDWADGMGELREIAGGMTLRDFFAGFALFGLLVNKTATVHSPDGQLRWHCRAAWRMADAMLDERETDDPRQDRDGPRSSG